MAALVIDDVLGVHFLSAHSVDAGPIRQRSSGEERPDRVCKTFS